MVDMIKPDKKTMVVSAGAGVGVVQTIYTKQLGAIPYLGDILPAPWGNWSTIGNILIGTAVFGITTFTNILAKSHNYINTGLQVYGLTILIGGLANGIFETTLSTKAKMLASAMPKSNGFFTDTYYPGVKGTFYRRPQSRAKGFASDVTKNPMAAIPTKIPYNKILF